MGITTRRAVERLTEDGQTPPLDTLDPTARPDKPAEDVSPKVSGIDTDTEQETPANDNA